MINILAFFFSVFAALVIALVSVHQSAKKRGLYSAASHTFAQNVLRPAGYNLARKVKKIKKEIMEESLVLFIALCGLLFIGYEFLDVESRTTTHLVGYILVFVISVVYLIGEISLKIIRGIKFQQGLDSELATAECLRDIESKGARVFHDVVMGKNKIDHVVVCEQGVFAIETKAWSKSKQGNLVAYDGSALRFPIMRTTEKPINDAVYHAQVLNGFILQTTGETIAVKPVVSLPGWSVLPMPQHPVHALCSTINPKNFHYLMNEKVLSVCQIEKIISQLSQACHMPTEEQYFYDSFGVVSDKKVYLQSRYSNYFNF